MGLKTQIQESLNAIVTFGGELHGLVNFRESAFKYQRLEGEIAVEGGSLSSNFSGFGVSLFLAYPNEKLPTEGGKRRRFSFCSLSRKALRQKTPINAINFLDGC